MDEGFARIESPLTDIDLRVLVPSSAPERPLKNLLSTRLNYPRITIPWQPLSSSQFVGQTTLAPSSRA